jgi:diketogulonate reductase-like aldo/keto reductase
MMLTRRQLVAAGAWASAGLSMTLGGLSAGAAPSSLITKNIPGTRERLPVIGLGTNRWVAAGDKNVIDQLRDTLVTFRELGGRVIDTAPSYQSSEKALGQLIAQLGIGDAFFLATKVDQEDKAAGIARMQDSLRKLNTERADLMQIHSMLGVDQQIGTLLDWKQQGRIRYIGVTTARTSQFAEIEQVMNTLAIDFIQINYSLSDRAAEERLLPLAIDKGIAVMVNRPFAHSNLFKDVSNQPVPDWAIEMGCSSWAQFFLKYVVSHPAVICAIPGTTKSAHVRDNMLAAHGELPDATFRMRQEQWFANL